MNAAIAPAKPLDVRQMKLFMCLVALHTALLVASNAGGAKMIAVPGGMAASATVFSYMATFVILDGIAELFGKAYSRLAINVGLLSIVASVIFFQISIAAPSADFWSGQDSYVATLGSSWRILLGGWAAYMFGQHFDVWSFFKLRESGFGSRNLWWRAWASTAIGQVFDTIIFMTIAFYGVFPLAPAIAGQYVLKLVLAAIATPVVYLIVKMGRAWISMEARRDA